MNAVYDADERATAASLEQQNPHWSVTWGYHSRLFWAYPMFNVPPGTIVHASSPQDLLALMRQTELSAGAGPYPMGPPL
ncbi:MAG TPA: hypothetical protein VGS19_21610 [Streptosporangiaceae bacterium]|nr:hypothetical protein [Streptosporangiaceae bacterium]